MADGVGVSDSELIGTARGAPVERYVLDNGRGLRVAILTLGGIIQSIEVPDRLGNSANVALGFSAFDDYATRNPFFGALVGRFANRIARARFTIDGTEYTVPASQPPNSLHGGLDGFDKRVWQVRRATATQLDLALESPDGDQGYPGALSVEVSYSVAQNENALRLDYRATADQPTVLNLTNHSYFHLGGEGSGSIDDHVLTIPAERYTPIDTTLIPTGALEPVAGTPLDFRAPMPIGARLRDGFAQLVLAQGYDFNYVVDGPPGTLRPAARVEHPSNGRILEVLTTEPGIQFYTGNFLDGTLVGPSGRIYRQGDGFTLETQHFPDSPNQPAFPTTVLRPGERFASTTIFKFSIA